MFKNASMFVCYLCSAIILSSWIGCSGSQDLSGKTLDFTITSQGDPITKARVDIIDGKFVITVAPITDPSGGEVYDEADRDKINAAVFLKSDGAVSSTKALNKTVSCAIELDFGGPQHAMADIAFLMDTTQTMGSKIDNLATSMRSYADYLTEAGYDINFAMVTLGDAYDTKNSSVSGYSVGTGSDEPPSFDMIERPLLDFTSSEEFKAFLSQVENNFTERDNGGDNAENYFAAVTASAGIGRDPILTSREGIVQYQVLMGDECSHTEEAPGLTEDKWVPLSKTALSLLSGDVTVHAVRNSALDSCATDQLSLADIADATGGVKLDLGDGTVDLSTLDLEEYITKYWLIYPTSCPLDKDTYELSLVLKVRDTEIMEREQRFLFEITLM